MTAADREVPGACGKEAVLGVAGRRGLIWQEGWRRCGAECWRGSEGGSPAAAAVRACGWACEVPPWPPPTRLSLL